MNIVQLRLISMALAAVITISIVYLAFTQKFSAITDIFSDLDAIKVEVEEKKPPPPPPPPPKDRPPPPPPPPVVQRETPPTPTAAPVPTELPVAPAPPPVSVITNPTWLERPNARDFARYYPERALERERTGRVVLDCVVAADGRIGCGVASEDPTGWGFGEAAVRISRSFRMSPRMENGAPTEGGRVRVPINFRLE
ncbi:MAG: energy transducer TonB [Hyphomonadaceae bacterium]|nr:energy transducer TonB [Hyphomonadaceae bacterium]